MNSILENIVEQKKISIENSKKHLPLNELKLRLVKNFGPSSFKSVISKKNSVNIIAEIKKASPSLGDIVKDFDPAKYARSYASGGASAISVLTEEQYFKGSILNLKIARDNSSLPILRKDFIIDTYQIYESLANGADAVLLIAALLEVSMMKEMIEISKDIGLDCLVEVHNEDELENVLKTPAEIIGINNRNLKDFKVDTSTALRLKKKIPENIIVVAESGIKCQEDIKKYFDSGINTFLIGETLMKSEDIGLTIKELKGAVNG